ncbi:MAG: thioester reductase domain-containing protein, partial [Planctomycetota bacterium]
RLGLSEEQFDQLALDLDVIYHNGAILNFAYSYEVMRDANVLGTHEVLRLAMQQRLKPVHYVSTIAVQGSVKRNAWEVVNESDPLPAFSSLKDAYSQTKWMSEKVIADARKRGLPVAIYRPGGVTGDSRTGKSNTGDMMHVMVLGCLHLGTIPSLDVELNLAPVDYIAGALVQLSLQPESFGQTFHLVNPEPLKIDSLVDFVKQTEVPVQRMPAEDWRDQVTARMEALPSDVFGLLTKAFMPDMLEGESADAVPAVLKLRYDCAHTTKGLAGSQIECPPMDSHLMRRYFQHLQESGLVSTAGDTTES